MLSHNGSNVWESFFEVFVNEWDTEESGTIADWLEKVEVPPDWLWGVCGLTQRLAELRRSMSNLGAAEKLLLCKLGGLTE